MSTLEQQSNRRKYMGFLSHALLIVIIFILPELVIAITMPHRRFNLNLLFYVRTAVYIAVFYINYFVIIDHTLVSDMSKRRILRFVLLNLLVLAVGLTICELISFHTFGSHPRHRPPKVEPTIWQGIIRMSGFILRDAVMIILTIALSVALRLSAKWKDIRQQQRELLSEQRATELDNLKSQLNPHFLFNTLNTIYALIAVDSDKAQKAVHQLSGLLRYMLYEDTGKVPLEKECRFIEDYVSLMRLRMANRLTEVSINTRTHSEAMIPALLFIPLVENAFKYGATATNGTPVSINIYTEGDELVCSTRNAFTPPAEDSAPARNSGIGLANLRRRISLIYGHRASLLAKADGNIFTATLKIPL